MYAPLLLRFSFLDSSPISLAIKDLGLRLQFDGKTQRLRKIRYSPASTPDNSQANYTVINYNGKTLFSCELSPTCETIASVFPPTMLGVFRQTDRTYTMSFKDGMNVEFRIKDSETFNILKDKNEHPVRLGTFSPPVQSVEVISSTPESPSPEELPRFEVHPYEGVKFVHPLTKKSAWIQLGSGIQDVMSVLGPPDHKGNNFLNFFNYGIDVKIDKDNACSVSKIVLHTNIPGHIGFGKYRRAWFDVVPQKGDKKSKASMDGSDIRVTNETSLRELNDIWNEPGKPLISSIPNFPNVQYFLQFHRGLNVEVNAVGVIASLEVCCR